MVEDGGFVWQIWSERILCFCAALLSALVLRSGAASANLMQVLVPVSAAADIEAVLLCGFARKKTRRTDDARWSLGGRLGE
jgi:hypothetical protein